MCALAAAPLGLWPTWDARVARFYLEGIAGLSPARTPSRDAIGSDLSASR
jgi:hypothetical protein